MLYYKEIYEYSCYLVGKRCNMLYHVIEKLIYCFNIMLYNIGEKMEAKDECKNIGIRWNANEIKLYERFIKAKKEYDKDKIRPTSCAEFVKILIDRALKDLEKNKEKNK